LLYNKADGIIVVSQGVGDDLATTFKVQKHKIGVIYNPIDVQKIQSLSEQNVGHPWFSENVPLIINVARLTRQKNQADLLKAFALVRKTTACRLVFLGEGELMDVLIDLSRQLHIDDAILFLGFQVNPYQYIARSTIFVLPSLYEGSPIALVEAMAVGCPVIATDCLAGPREILAPDMPIQQKIEGVTESEYGILVPVGDTTALKEAINRLLVNPQLREQYSTLGRERAKDFMLDIAIKKYLEALR
jgi:glycosyltransferase involved in cell wall biosynthesis